MDFINDYKNIFRGIWQHQQQFMNKARNYKLYRSLPKAVFFESFTKNEYC